MTSSTAVLIDDSAARQEAYECLRDGALAGADVPNLPERDRVTLVRAAELADQLAERAGSARPVEGETVAQRIERLQGRITELEAEAGD